MGPAHRKYVSLDGAIYDIPEALVNHEWGLAVITSVLVGL